MSKIDPLADIGANYASITKINANMAKIEAAIENTVSRDGSAPNFMTADLDMNSKQLLNLGTPVDSTNAVTKGYVDSLFSGATDVNFLTRPEGTGLIYLSTTTAAIGPKVVFVDLYANIFSDGSADSTAGLKTLIAAQGVTNVEYVFNPNGTYKLYSTDDINTSVGSIINAVCTNLYLNFGGCTIEIDRTFANGSSSFPFQFINGSRDIRIGRHRLIQDKEWAFADLYNAGTWWLFFTDSVTNVHIEESYCENIRVFLDCTRGATATNRVRNVVCDGITAVHTAYPVSLRNNGDDVHIRYLHTFEAGRPIIAYNWHGLLKIDELIEQDSATQIKLLNNGSGSSLYSADAVTGACEINHIGLAPTGQADFGRAYRMSIEQRGTTAGTFGPLYIKSHTTLGTSEGNSQGLVTILKRLDDSTNDTVTRGHRICLVLDAEIHNCVATEVASFFETANGDWVGESVDFIVDKLVTSGNTGSSVGIDFDGMLTGPLFRYVNMVGTLSTTGTPSSTYTKLIYRDSSGVTGTNVPLINRSNIFTEEQIQTKANPRHTLNNSNGTASTIQMGADSGYVFLGSTTNSNVRFLRNNTQIGDVVAEGLRSELSMIVKDGITAPSTMAGYAQIYVDTADGDLKVKFGDGTVKTIVVDT